MGWVPPQMPQRPGWMSDDQWRSLVKREIEMLHEVELSVATTRVLCMSILTCSVLVAAIFVLVATVVKG